MAEKKQRSNMATARFGSGKGNTLRIEFNEVEDEVIPTVVITNNRTGYTIQALKGASGVTYDPAVIVPTYEAQVVLAKGDEKECIFSFDITRDAWYSLGKNNNGEHELLNRAFVPDNWERNLYGAKWIPSYPDPISTTYLPTGLDAFIFTRFGKRKVPAKPLATQKRLDGSSITSPRGVENLATDVMIHIGGTYEANTFDHLGGSYGCFGYIQKEDIFDTPELAKKASDDDDYDDNYTNKDWEKVANKIKNLWNNTKKMHILLEYRDESNNYYPKIVIRE